METLLALLVIREGNPPVTSEPRRKGQAIFSMIHEKAVVQTVELYMVLDTAKINGMLSWWCMSWAYVINFVTW